MSFFTNLRQKLSTTDSAQKSSALDLFKYIGPGLLVTVGFIDPGNWASNFAAGSEFGYALLWVVTLSTVILVILQHNVAHLGIVTGLCLSEAANKFLPKSASLTTLGSAIGASIATSLAEILGGAIAVNMLFNVPIKVGATLVTVFVVVMMFCSGYRRIERYIIAFVSLIGLSFIYELFLIDVAWGQAALAWVTPSIPQGSMLLIVSVLGAVVMPHNLFLHSEVIQSREWNLQDEKVIEKQLKYEFLDTSLSMAIGWAINSAMIILAAATFFTNNVTVNDLQQAQSLLEPALGRSAAVVFALALLLAGISSAMTSGVAAGSIVAGMFNEPYNIKDIHSRLGILLSLGAGLLIVFLIGDPFKGLIISQAILSIQLPVTIFLQVRLTSSPKVMGKYANRPLTKWLLYAIALAVTALNVLLLLSFFVDISFTGF
ncbi:MAG: Nramp family divalent metal transporter [Prevotellaceae bacterium]|jgi:manganese transport protein|nr:Nramp family divalent metal transporter [Prevotellaceae bacterium]